MVRMQGAKLWVNKISDVEQSALEQISNMLTNTATIRDVDVGVSIMPDVHTGYGVPIGSVWVLKDHISPEAVGYDIGCGVFACRLPIKVEEIENKDKLASLNAKIRRFLPVGFNHRSERHHIDIINQLITSVGCEEPMQYLETVQHFTKIPIRHQLGTLGGGNHFIELSVDQNDNVWLVIHSGSRKLGYDIAQHYMEMAKTIDKINAIPVINIKNSYGISYITHMQTALWFAKMNRVFMALIVANKINDVYCTDYTLDINNTNIIDVPHNFAELIGQNHHVVHRKGATAACKGQEVIIPGSMGTHTYIGIGKGNPLSYNSCSHGAGRKMSRNKAKKELSLDKFQDDMKGVFSTSITEKHLDECPDAYKNVDDVIKLQDDLITVTHTLTPIFNIKG